MGEKTLISPRNVEIDILKVLFAFVIVVFHAHNLQSVSGTFFPRGYLAVEFFFIISGFFMGRKLRNPNAPSTARFLVGKIVPIYPVFFVSTLIVFFLRMSTLGWANCAEWVRSVFLAIPEFCLVQMAGAKVGRGYNGVTWYISAMLLVMAILYPLFRRFRDYFRFPGALLVALVCYAVINRNFANFCVAAEWTGFCTYGVVRAAAGISLGVFLEECVQRAKPIQLSRAGSIVACALKNLLLVLLLAGMANAIRWKLPGSMDYIFVFVFFIFLFLVLSGLGGSIKLHSAGWLGQASLYLYLNHRGMIWVLVQSQPEAPMRVAVPLYVVGTLLSMVLCFVGVKMLHWLVGLCMRTLVQSPKIEEAQ